MTPSENVYSMAIETLADEYTAPTDERVQAWLDELAGDAATTAQSDAHTADPAQLLENVYAMVIKNLAQSHPEEPGAGRPGLASSSAAPTRPPPPTPTTSHPASSLPRRLRWHWVRF